MIPIRGRKQYVKIMLIAHNSLQLVKLNDPH